MNENSTPAPDALQRRVDDMPMPGHSLDWGEDGSPLPPSTAVYQYRPLADERHRLWADIKTEELLAYVQAAPERFELRVLFKESIEDLVRAPSVVVLTALAALDRSRSEAEAAKAKLRAALASLGGMP